MKGYPVIKGTSYTLAATPDMVIYNGTTQTTERVVNPDSGYLVELPEHPWFVGVQFHPEFKSRPNKAHPLFRDFIGAAVASAARTH